MSVGGAGKCLIIILPLLCVIFNIVLFQSEVTDHLYSSEILTGNELVQNDVADPQLSFNSKHQKQNENKNTQDERKSVEKHEINDDQNLIDPNIEKNNRKSEISIMKHLNNNDIFNAMANVTAASVRHMFWAGFCVSISLKMYQTGKKYHWDLLMKYYLYVLQFDRINT